jgi:hypothetical protein
MQRAFLGSVQPGKLTAMCLCNSNFSNFHSRVRSCTAFQSHIPLLFQLQVGSYLKHQITTTAKAVAIHTVIYDLDS